MAEQTQENARVRGSSALTCYALYTVQRVKTGNVLYNLKHGATTGDRTICGIELDHHWYISNNTFDGDISCQKCLKLLKTRLYHEL